MTETEKLQQQIASLEGEQATLHTDLATLAERVKGAQVNADAAAATAERAPSPEADAAAASAETELQTLEVQCRRKRAALAACTTDLATARRALAESQAAGLLVMLQAALAEVEALAAQIDLAPMEVELWGALSEQVKEGQTLFRQAGVNGQLDTTPLWVRGKLFGAHAAGIDWTMGDRSGETPKPIPPMAELLGLDHAAGALRVLLGVA